MGLPCLTFPSTSPLLALFSFQEKFARCRFFGRDLRADSLFLLLLFFLCLSIVFSPGPPETARYREGLVVVFHVPGKGLYLSSK